MNIKKCSNETNIYLIDAYDELVECNLSRDTYKILYQVKDKYVTAGAEGSLSGMLDKDARHMVHPEDLQAFKRFWSGDRLRESLDKGDVNEGAVLRGQFRRKMVDGTYCRVSHTGILIKRGGDDDQIFLCFIQDTGQGNRELEMAAPAPDYEVDRLTGLLRRTMFFKHAQEFIAQSQGSYCLVAVDIEHLKLFNEWYGQEEGDRLLAGVGSRLNMIQEIYGGIAGYMGGDDFVVMIRDEGEVIGQVQKRIMEYVRQCGRAAGFLPAFGIYTIGDRRISVSTMYDRACIALASVKGSFAQRSCRYDSHMMRKMEENHKLLSEIQKGLEQGEFTFYAQPKCNLCTGKIVGLEALVRWDHPVRGIVSPGEFIPILENNGLITKLDLYLWEEVCRKLRGWIDMGLKVVPVSVNVSRMDIYAVDVASVFRRLTEKYSLEPRLLEVEITESAYVEEYKVITGVVKALRESGFTVLMDDFGSGYSSLNMLKDVNVDVLKIDMKFLEMDEGTIRKGVEILEAITRLGNIMGMRMIAEGIETKEQVDFLMNMGCAYGQGYYFFRPMPIEGYEPLLSDEGNFDYRGIKAKQMDRIGLKDLFEEDIASDAMMNNILGAVAFYELRDGEIELLRVNEQYCILTGNNAVDLEVQRKSILQDTWEEDRTRVLGIFTEAYEHPFTGARGNIRRKKADGTYMWMHMRVFFLREQDGSRMFYGAVSDVTEQMDRERRLEASKRALSAVTQLSAQELTFKGLTKENRQAVASVFARLIPAGMMGSRCENGFPLYFADSEMLKLLGYDSYEEFHRAILGLVINAIHPEDREQVTWDRGSECGFGFEYTTIYRMFKKDGSWIWVLDKGLVVREENGGRSFVSRCTDVTETMEVQRMLSEVS